MRTIAIVALGFLTATGAKAQESIRNFNQNTVFKSIQCELGLFALKAKRVGLSPALRAHIKYSMEGTAGNSASVEAGLGGWFERVLRLPTAKAAHDFQRIDKSTIEGKLNINQGNVGACFGPHRTPSIPLNIDNCLSDNLDPLKGEGL